jgi:DNA-binding MarR family transcriptional regulator
METKECIMQDVIAGRAAEATMADGQATLMETERAVWRFTAIRAIVAIGCPEELRDGPRAVGEIADRCGAHAPTLARLLRTVAQTGLVRSVPPDRYELTPAGQALLEGRQAMSIRYSADPEIWGALGELTETVQTGNAPFVERHGSLYNYLAGKPGLSAIFDAFMNVNYWPLAVKVAEVGAFQAGEMVVDVGGGQGTFLAAILQANPGTSGILLDLARTMPVAREYLATTGVADRCELVAGDFFEAAPAGDTYLLSHVLHNWDDNSSLRILRVIRELIPAHGRVLIVEMPLPDDDSPHRGKDLDIRLLTLHPGGRERSQAQYGALLAEAGFLLAGMTELGREEYLITASPGGS